MDYHWYKLAVSTFALVVLLYFGVGNPDGKLKNGVLIPDPDFAFSGFGSSSLWLLIAGFVISIAMTQSGVAKRLALHMMKILGKTLKHQLVRYLLRLSQILLLRRLRRQIRLVQLPL